MSEQTKIQWCDSTINFWRGCTKVSPGCAHCYAEKNIGVKMQGIKWGKGQPRVKSKRAVEEALADPLRHDRAASARSFFLERLVELRPILMRMPRNPSDKCIKA